MPLCALRLCSWEEGVRPHSGLARHSMCSKCPLGWNIADAGTCLGLERAKKGQTQGPSFCPGAGPERAPNRPQTGPALWEVLPGSLSWPTGSGGPASGPERDPLPAAWLRNSYEGQGLGWPGLHCCFCSHEEPCHLGPRAPNLGLPFLTPEMARHRRQDSERFAGVCIRPDTEALSWPSHSHDPGAEPHRATTPSRAPRSPGPGSFPP